ncbi:hypothetical protein NECAME_06855 [Necator americanus]|uniref:Uncharacterized protein n=1 Tax=Necator americanus TaxID=51031 RepID=W2TS88_NECAM|nr:hypothetical protein NECAME_06855 [Necator americanus]ETN84534.1 hypothetical protein NECAME_06855 [Necator americanus]
MTKRHINPEDGFLCRITLVSLYNAILLADVRPFTGSENKMKIGNNDDNLIGPIGTSGTDLQAKDKLSFNNENQQPAEAAHLSNFLTVAPTAKENAIPSLPSDPQKFAKSALTVTPEQRQVFTTEKSSNENRASSNLVGPTTEKPSNEIKASSNIVVPLSVDSVPERTEKRSAAIATKSHSPKKRDTVPTIDSNAQGLEGMSTHPYKTITITKTSWENNSSINESVVRKSPAKTKGVVSTTVSLNQSGGKRLESGSSPSRTPPPHSHTVPSIQQKPHEFSVPTNPPVTSKPSPISPRIGGNNCTTPAPILSSSSSQAKEKKSSAARQPSTGGPRSPRRALSSPAPLGLNNIESDSSSLSTISDKTNLTTKPYSPTNGKLKSSTKPRSVEEAAKAAIVARKTPHHPLPKDSKKIIHDTEKALNNPFLTSPRK